MLNPVGLAHEDVPGRPSGKSTGHHHSVCRIEWIFCICVMVAVGLAAIWPQAIHYFKRGITCGLE